MEERIIDISDGGASLSVRLEQLVLFRDGHETTVPLADIAALVVSYPAVQYTHAVLAGLASCGGSLIVCNEKRLPIGLMLPITGHYVQAEQISAQASAPEPLKKQLWKQLVQAKIKAQGRALAITCGHDLGLVRLALEVKSGDTSNVEAQAARRYWQALLGETFRRVPGAEDPINSLLNYGYAVLRGVVGRAVCAAGLHPSLGLHHHNRYNAFCLVDDLMEPYRPLVDLGVVKLVAERGPEVELDREAKTVLIGRFIHDRFVLEGKSLTLFDIVARLATSLAAAYLGKRKKLLIAEL